MITLRKKKLASMGPDTVLIIPRAYIRDELLDSNKVYNVTFEEVKEKKSKEVQNK